MEISWDQIAAIDGARTNEHSLHGGFGHSPAKQGMQIISRTNSVGTGLLRGQLSDRSYSRRDGQRRRRYACGMKLVFIHGAPGAGKLTTAQALLDRVEGRLFDIMPRSM